MVKQVILFFILILSILTLRSFAEDLSNDVCLSCHNDPELVKELPGGKKVSVFVNEEKFKKSVHGANDCISCHADITEVPHQENLAKVDCSVCHGDVNDVYQASSHGKAL